MSDKDIFRLLRGATADNPVATAYLQTVTEELAIARAELEAREFKDGMLGELDKHEAWANIRGYEGSLFHEVARNLLLIPPAPEKIVPAPSVTSEETVDEMYSLLVDLAEHTPCQLGSHGHCQEHGWLDSRRCPHARAQELLKARKV